MMHNKKAKKQGLYILIGLPLIPVGLSVYLLNQYLGLDSIVRLYASCLIVFIYLAIMLLGFYFVNKRLKVGTLIISLIAVLFLIGSSYFSYVNIRIYASLNQMVRNQSEINYSLVTLSQGKINLESDLDHKKIGIINLSDVRIVDAIEDYLNEKKLIESNEIVRFNNPTEMLHHLYTGEIDAMVIGSGFVSLFSDSDRFTNIESETQILDTFTVMTENAFLDNSSIVEEPFSILLLGTNSMLEGEIDFGQVNTLILMTINPQNLSVTMTSIPRDSYVSVPCFNYTKDKLSHTHNVGTTCVIETVEHLLNIEIPYYVKLNFRGMVNLVDTLGGIEVEVPITISEQNSRRQFGEHMITVEEGLQILDGEQALALSRHRKTLTNGDFGRVGHQQLVLEGIANRILTEVYSVSEMLAILDVLGENLDTNLSIMEITSIVRYLLELVPANPNSNPLEEVHIKNMVLSGEVSTVQTVYYEFPLSVIFLYEGAIRDSRELMLINLERIEPEMSYSFSYDGFNSNQTMWVQPFYDEPQSIENMN